MRGLLLHLCRRVHGPLAHATAWQPGAPKPLGAVGAPGLRLGGGASPPSRINRWQCSNAADGGAVRAKEGDVVSIHYEGTLGDGSVFDSSRAGGGTGVTFTVGCGGVVPGVERAVVGLAAGEQRTACVPPEDGYGERSMDLVAALPRSKAPKEIAVGQVVRVSNGATALVTIVDDEEVVIDGNHMLAGEHLTYDIEMLDVVDGRTLEDATFGMGCFWGAELAFQGVVTTCVGYSNGHVDDPSYEMVCTGDTGHAEVVQLRFHPGEVTYERILETFFGSHDPTQVDRQGNDVGTQYRSAIFTHNEEQRSVAERAIRNEAERLGTPLATVLEPVENFTMAEGTHQRYLEKRGQDASKGCEVPIRCYG